MPDNLIFDRTKADTDRANSLAAKVGSGKATPADMAEWETDLRGRWNAADANRVEAWTQYLADLLLSYGYSVPVATKGNWVETDFPNRTEADRIRSNIDALQTGFYALPDWREIVYNNGLDFGQANALEWDLQRIYDWLNAMAAWANMRQAGTIFMQAGGLLNG